MSNYYVYIMRIAENQKYFGSYIGQHKMGKKSPYDDGYKGSGSKWKEYILNNHIPVEKTVLKLCDSVEEANYWEQYYIAQFRELGECLWNVVKGGGSYDRQRIYTDEEIKLHNRERLQRWCKSNEEHFKEYKRQYYINNKEELSVKKKQYRENHKDSLTKYFQCYYEDNKSRIAEKNKVYWEKNRERFSEHKKEYYKQYKVTHAEHESQRHKKYNDEHKEERDRYYSRQCCYDGEVLTFRALTLRFRRQNVSKPTDEAKKYLITKEEN